MKGYGRGDMICIWTLVSTVLAALTFILIFGNGIFASDSPPLNVAYSAFASTYLPLWVADVTGDFKSQGLNIDISYGRGGSSTSQALLARSIDVALIGGGPIEANLSGGDLVYIAAHVPTLVFSLF